MSIYPLVYRKAAQITEHDAPGELVICAIKVNWVQCHRNFQMAWVFDITQVLPFMDHYLKDRTHIFKPVDVTIILRLCMLCAWLQYCCYDLQSNIRPFVCRLANWQEIADVLLRPVLLIRASGKHAVPHTNPCAVDPVHPNTVDVLKNTPLASTCPVTEWILRTLWNLNTRRKKKHKNGYGLLHGSLPIINLK